MDNIKTLHAEAIPFNVSFAQDADGVFNYVVNDGCALLDNKLINVAGISGVGDADLYLTLYEVRRNAWQKYRWRKNKDDEWHEVIGLKFDMKYSNYSHAEYCGVIGAKQTEGVQGENLAYQKWATIGTEYRDYSDEFFGGWYPVSAKIDLGILEENSNYYTVDGCKVPGSDTYWSSIIEHPENVPWDTVIPFETRRVLASRPIIKIRNGKLERFDTAWMCVGMPEMVESDKNFRIEYASGEPGNIKVTESNIVINTPRTAPEGDTKSPRDNNEGEMPHRRDDTSPTITACSCQWCREHNVNFADMARDIRTLIKDIRKRAELICNAQNMDMEQITMWDDDLNKIGVYA